MSRSDHIVIMNNVVVPGIVDIEVSKNMINDNARGISDIELDGKNTLSGNAKIFTTVNVEDFYETGAPLIVLRRIGSEGQLQSAAAYSYMAQMDYGDGGNSAAILASMIAAGYTPVFVGMCASYHSGYSNSNENSMYSHMINGFDFLVLLYDSYSSVENNTSFEDVYSRLFKKHGNKYIKTSDKSNKATENYNGVTYIAKQPFLNTFIKMFAERSPKYAGFLSKISSGALNNVKTGFANKLNAIDIAKVMTFRSFAKFKVPLNFEDDVEFVRGASLHYMMSSGTEKRVVTRRPSELLPLLTAVPFYELFVREDTGEFVYRRSSALSPRGGIVRSKQRYQNAGLPIIPPLQNIIGYEKLLGGKLGNVPLLQVAGEISTGLGNTSLSTSLGTEQRRKFGSDILRLDDNFSGIETLDDDVEGNTGQFCSSDYFVSKSGISKLLDIDTQFQRLYSASFDEKKKTERRKMLTYMTKYYYTLPYAIWITFSTYFAAPIGSVINLSGIKPSPASAFGAVSQAVDVGRSIVNSPMSKFESQENAHLYRIVGKSYKASYRRDGEYTERYSLWLGNVAQGLAVD